MSNQLSMEKHKVKLLLFVLFLALAVRLSVFPNVFSNGNITFLGADTYYHIRRILFTVLHFPSPLDFDSYINFPYGTNIGWVPLYDEFVALIALIAGLGKPSLYTVEVTAAIVPPLLGVLTVLLVYLITEEIFDWRMGLISAGIFAITPAYVYVSFLGYADHHVAETLLSTATYLCFIVAMKRSQRNVYLNLGDSILKNPFSILTGIMLAFSILTWNGAPIFVGLVGIFIIVQFVIDQWSGRNSDYLIITGGIAFIVSFFIITPVAITQGMVFEFNSFSPTLFHAGFLAAFFLLCVLLALMQSMHLKKWWYHPLLLAILFVSVLYSLELLFPNLYQAVTKGVTYLFGGGVLATIQEAVPLFVNPGTGYTLNNVWNAFTLSFFIAMISFIYFIKRTIAEKYPFESMFLIVWTSIVLILTILQRRFIYLLAVNIAIFSAYFIIITLKFFTAKPVEKRTITKKRRKSQNASTHTYNIGPIIGVCMVLLLAIPNLIVIKSMATTSIPIPDPDLQESFKWLRDNTPPTNYYNSPDKPAEYGIMSWWDYGNWILYFSQRPVVADNFQDGLEDAALFLTSSDEKEANKILNARNVRFIITDAQMLKLKFRYIAALAGKNPSDYYGTKGEVAQIRSVNDENRNFFATMLSRLHVFDSNGLSNYRLIYESKTTAIKSPDIKYVKISEYVKGATISGKAPDGNIKVTLNVLTNQGRNFIYTQEATANNGRYEIKVPYSTMGNKYGTKSSGDYIIQSANISKTVSVSEEDVVEGRDIQMDLV